MRLVFVELTKPIPDRSYNLRFNVIRNFRLSFGLGRECEGSARVSLHVVHRFTRLADVHEPMIDNTHSIQPNHRLFDEIFVLFGRLLVYKLIDLTTIWHSFVFGAFESSNSNRWHVANYSKF